VVPDNVKSIGYAAFENCHYLKKVIIPGNEISFGKSTFYGCNLTVYATYNIEIPGVPKTWFAKMSLDQLLHYAPFSVYAKEYVEQHINEWQKRGEFEKTNDWLQRVNDSSRQHKINTLVAEAEQQYLDYWTSRKSLNLQLGRYDADNEVFAITDDNYGTAYIAVPFNEAQAFKSNWNKKKITNRIQIKNDQFKIAFLSIKMPKGKEYTYRNTDAVNYNLAEYNFDPIELNLNNASPEQSNISKTKVQVGKSEVDTDIPTTKVSNPNTFAIIIANEDYKHAASVPFAKNDGAVFQQYCQKTLGVPVNNIHYVENASFNDMRIQLSWLKDVCEAFNGQASVILYYTGHGFPDQATDANYLLPTDGDSRYVTSAYKIEDLYRNLGALNAQSVTVFLDACFSGTTRDDKTMLTQGTHSVAYKVNMSQPQGKTVVFAAAQEKETAYPDNEQQHGMFTYYLLKKLQETKGDVTLRDLGTYVTTNVRQQSIVKNGKTQTPTVTASHSLGSDWQNWTLK
ncbi:MAG: caspase family protein, partial [Bacteroidales bacterium]|nr:caspase family protein [Bacteroidales bacterium]